MYQSPDFPVTSIKSLLSTIKLDRQVCRWFVYLIECGAVRRELREENDIKIAYYRLKIVSFLERILYFGLVGTLLFIAITKGLQYSPVIVVFIIMAPVLGMKKREYILSICSVLINRDFKVFEFEKKTLFQIGEFYATKYQVTPLINTITSSDTAIRMTVLFAAIFVLYIYPLKFWQNGTIVLAAYFIAYGVVNSPYVYKRIKK